MTGDYLRYAIYWVPPEATGLAAFGKRWAGWCEGGSDQASPRMARDLPRGPAGSHCAVVERGLHGTLGAPFRLGPGRSVWRLEQALSDVARTMPAVVLPRLEVAVHDGRVVLAPRATPGTLERLQGRVADIVTLIQGVPAQPRAARRPTVAGCIPLPGGAVHQAPLVEPFVMPLTDRMEPATARDLATELAPRLEALLALPARIADLALMADPGRGRRWRLLERYRLAGEAPSARTRIPAGMICAHTGAMPPLNAMLGSDWDTVIA